MPPRCLPIPGRPLIGTRRCPAPEPRCSPNVAGSLSRGFRRNGPVVRLCAPQCLDDVPGVVDGAAPALHPAHWCGGDQRQTRRRQRVGGYRHARFRRCANRSAARAAVDETRVGWAAGRAARGALRNDHAAIDGGRHDDLPGVVDGRPRCTGGPHRILGARRRDPGGGAAHRVAAEPVLRSRWRRAWRARRSSR